MSDYFKSTPFLIVVTVIISVGLLAVAMKYSKSEKESSTEYTTKSWGKEDSKVVITEYGDFQCEACLNFYMTVEKELKANYGDKIKFEYKYLNLDGHPNSRLAAEAAEAANAQGKFWEFHDLLFERQEKEAHLWTIENLTSYAGELGLDTEQFRNELKSGQYRKTVEVPAIEGANKGYRGTPSVEVNGKQISRPTYATLEAEIKKILEAQ